MFTIIAVAVGLVLACVALHGTTMLNTAKFLVPKKKQFGFTRIGMLIVVAMVAHLIQIVFFQIAYVCLVSGTEQGAVIGVINPSWGDLFYFSAMTYTATGYGDLVPTGNLRFLATVEALTGLIMVAWTASFAFLVMQRYWFTRDRDL